MGGCGPAHGNWAVANVDNILYWGEDIEGYRKANKDILDRCARRNVRLAWRKAKWVCPQVTFCGREISSNSIGASKAKLGQLRDLRAPTNKAEIGHLIGLAEWHNSFIKDFHLTMAPIYRARRESKPGTPLVWSEECAQAWATIVAECDKRYVRALAGPGVYHLYADASLDAVSSHLVRVHDKVVHPMSYGGRSFSESQYKWDMPRKELFAIYAAVKKHWYTLQGRDVVIHTDAESWADLVVKAPSTQVANWITAIGSLAPKSIHIRGVANVVCDAINRMMAKDVDIASPEIVGAAVLVCLATLAMAPAKFTFVEDTGSFVPSDSPPSVMAGVTVAADPAMPKIRSSLDKSQAVWVPPSLRDACLHSVHFGPLGCHASPDAMWRSIRPRYWWEGMGADIKGFKCDSCMALKPPSRDLHNSMSSPPTPSRPWQVVGMDPVPVTLPNGEKANFVLFADYFTKEVVVSNLSSTTTGNLLAKFQRLVIAAKSTPELLISDGGVNLTSAAFNSFCIENGIEHHHSARYHQQGNSFAERCIKTFKPLFFIKLYKDKMKYKDALFYTAQALNKNMSSKTTGFTPHELATRDHYNTPFDNLLRKYSQRAQRICDRAKSNIARAKTIQKLAYDKKKTDRFFHVGDLV